VVALWVVVLIVLFRCMRAGTGTRPYMIVPVNRIVRRRGTPVVALWVVVLIVLFRCIRAGTGTRPYMIVPVNRIVRRRGNPPWLPCLWLSHVCSRRPRIKAGTGTRAGTGTCPYISLFMSPISSAINRNCSRAASRSSTISAAMTSGSGRLSVSSSDSSRSQKMSRFTLSRAMISS
jgi:hypothetical protein